jgi:Glycosyl hydrolase family 26
MNIEDLIRAANPVRTSALDAGDAPRARRALAKILQSPAVRSRWSFLLAYGGGEKKGPSAHRAWPRRLAPAASAVLVVGVIAVSAVVFTGSRPAPSSPGGPLGARPAVHPVLSSQPSSYLGVSVPGLLPSYQPIAEFAQTVGRRPNLVETFSGWAEPFPRSYAQTIRRHGAVLIVQIDPAYASIAGIAAGEYDAYLRFYADSVRAFGAPVVIGFGHEMNGAWYTWGYQHAPASVFVAAWRHIVTLFRSQRANNVTWLWTINVDGRDIAPAVRWWPGASYVTWVGIDGYYLRPADTFDTVFARTIDQIREFTSKPVLLSQTAISPGAHQYIKIPDLFRGIQKYKALGLVWFDQTQRHGTHDQDLRLEDNVSAGAIFRLEASMLRLARPAS